MKQRVLTIWPAKHDGEPGGNWRQDRRWLVLDVTEGLDAAIVLHRCEGRAEALEYERALRSGVAVGP